MSDTITVPRGLAGVVVTDTEVGDVRGDEGYYHYRGHRATDLARTVTVEEAWHLLVLGTLPDERELAHFRDRVSVLRALPADVVEILPAIVRTTADPLTVLRTTLSVWGGSVGLRPLYDADEDERLEAALRIVAVTPTILAASHRLALGLEPITPDPALGRPGGSRGPLGQNGGGASHPGGRGAWCFAWFAVGSVRFRRPGGG